MPTQSTTLSLLGKQIWKMSPLAHLLLLLGALALVGMWLAPWLSGAPVSTPCSQKILPAKVPGRVTRIVSIKPDDFRRHDILCVTVENVVTAEAQAQARDALAKSETLVEQAQADKVAAEAASVSAPVAEMERAKQAIAVQAARLDEARKLRDARSDELKAATAKRHFFLYFNGNKSPFSADAISTPDQQTLRFTLDDSPDAKNDLAIFWRKVLTQPISDGKVNTQLALGDGTDASISYAADTMVVNRVVAYGKLVRWGSLFVLFTAVVWLLTLAVTTPLLRSGDNLGTSYSLARVQMLFWFLLITGGYCYIWLVAGQWMNVMNSSTLALLGISGVATGAALTIDSAKWKDAAGVPLPLPRTSGSFLRDIASDGADNIQIQRIQMILWTLILGGIFIWTVAAKLELPDFDAHLLALAGIVNGVYVALKTQEPQPPADGDADDPGTAGPG